MKGKNLVLWILAGAGVILMYSAYHNISPTSLLAKYAGLSPATSPLTSTSGFGNSGDSQVPGTDSKGNAQTPWGQSGDSTDNPQRYLSNGRAIELSPYSGQWEQVTADGYSAGAIPTGYQLSPGTFIGDGAVSV